MQLKKIIWIIEILILIQLVSATWANDSYNSCKNVTITNNQSIALTNYPVLVTITYGNMQSNFADVQFYNTSCNSTSATSRLYAEMDNYTSSTTAYVWVKIPNLATGNNIISMYYNNATITSVWDNGANVWDTNYVAVLHMNNAHDSSSYQNNGTVKGNVVFQSGILSNGAFFNGSSGNAINLSRVSSLNVSIGTFEGWGNPRTIPASSRIISREGTTSAQPYALEYSTTGPTAQLCTLTNGTTSEQCSGTSGSGKTAYNSWNYIVGIYNGTERTMYFNGTRNVTASLKGTLNQSYNNAVVIGNNDALSRQMNGTLDEVRISNIGRSRSWINYTYLIISNNAAWVSFGTEINRTSGATTTCTYSGSGDWSITCSDNCALTATNLLRNKIIFTGSGTITGLRNVTNWTSIRMPNGGCPLFI